MALEQITGLNFRDKRMLLDVSEDSGTDLRAAMYNSTHFEIPRTFDVSIEHVVISRPQGGCRIVIILIIYCVVVKPTVSTELMLQFSGLYYLTIVK